MTLTGLTLMSAVALVNLTLGFGAAALVGRGPWSARARSARPSGGGDHPAFKSGSANSDQSGIELPARTAPPVEVAVTDPPTTDQTLDRMQSVAAGVEGIEQALQALRQQIQTSGETPPKELLPQWAATMITQANHLSEIHDEFRRIAEHNRLSAETLQPALELFSDLQQKFQRTVVQIGQVRNSNVDRCEAVADVLAACQTVRGTITASSFIQTQP